MRPHLRLPYMLLALAVIGCRDAAPPPAKKADALPPQRLVALLGPGSASRRSTSDTLWLSGEGRFVRVARGGSGT